VVDRKKEKGIECFSYNTIFTLQNFYDDKFIDEIENGNVCVDIDAIMRYNHGTKFRIKNIKIMKLLYEKSREIS